MRAWLLDRPGPPSSLRLADIPSPWRTPATQRGEIEVLVHVEAVGLNPVDFQTAARAIRTGDIRTSSDSTSRGAWWQCTQSQLPGCPRGGSCPSPGRGSCCARTSGNRGFRRVPVGGPRRPCRHPAGVGSHRSREPAHTGPGRPGRGRAAPASDSRAQGPGARGLGRSGGPVRAVGHPLRCHRHRVGASGERGDGPRAGGHVRP